MFRPLASTKVYAQSARVRVFLLSMMVLIVPLFIYFSFHVTSRSKYFKDRNFRQLNNFSRQISDRINNLGTAFSNSVEKFVRADKSDKEWQELTGDDRAKYQAYLDILKTDGTYFTATTVEPVPTVDPKTDLGLRVSIYLAHEEGTPWLFFDCVGLGGKIHFVAKTNFDQLVRRRLNKVGDEGLPEEFDHVIIARADNSKALFDSANDDLKLTSLDSIHLADAPDKTLDLRTRSKTTDSVDITLAGARYRLYAQPIEIVLRTKDSESPETLWVICGLVEASRFRYQTWAISHTVLIVSAFFAGFLLLSWSFLKLVFLGPKDRLRVAETLVLAVSVVIAGSLLTFFFLFSVTYTQFERKGDRQLFALAKNFQENFKLEVGKAVQQIDSLDDSRPELSKSDPQQVESDLKANKFSKTNILQEHICEGGSCDRNKNPYPYFKAAIWIDEKGDQLSKWSINSQTTRRVPVTNREYFSKIKNGYYREMGGERFWLEPVNSKNTAGFVVVISKEAQADKIPKASVVALDINLMSLTKPAIVSGFSYRIISGNGDVLFPNIRENFFAECDNNQRLRSAVTGHLSDFANVPYLGRDVRVYVTPLGGLPDWTLVVFRDKEPVRSTFSEIVALSGSLFLIYLLPLLLFLTIVFVASAITGRRMKWMWPASDAMAVYLQFIAASLLFILVAYLLPSRRSDLGSVVLLSSTSVVALLLLMVSLQRNWAIKPFVNLAGYLERTQSRINFRLLYPLCLVALTFIIAVFPSLTFFRLAYNAEMDLYVKYGQMTLVNSLNEREERVRAAYPMKIFGNQKAADTFTAHRLKEDLDRYYGFFFNTKITENECPISRTEIEHGPVLLQVRKLLPLSQQSSIIRRGLVASESADGLWRWGSNDRSLTLQVPQASANGKIFLNIASTRKRYPVTGRTLFFFLPLMALGLFFLIRFILNRVFLLDTIGFPNPDIETPALSNIQKLFLVLGSPFTRGKKLLPADSRVLNLKNGGSNGELFKNFDLNTFLQESRSKRIWVECFDHQIDQPHYNLQKLDFLEKLMTHDGELLISSSAEPTDYLFENGDKTSHRSTSEARARWANVMSNFWLEYWEDSGDAKEFKAELSRKQEESCDEAEKRFYGLLIEECSPRACLQDIGRAIANRRNPRTSSADDLIGDVLVQADTYYQLIWESCSPTERLTLAHMAMDGFLSVNDPDVPKLVRRGLIVRGREVRLMNESFRLFVLTKSRTDKEVAVCEGQARKSSSWQYMKVALSVTVIVLMIFLFATQRDLYNSTIVALTSIAAGVPAIFNFFNILQKNIGSAASAPRPEA